MIGTNTSATEQYSYFILTVLIQLYLHRQVRLIRCVSVSCMYFTAQLLGSLFCKCTMRCTSTKPKPPLFLNACKYNTRSFGCGTAKCSQEQTVIWVIVARVQYCPMKAHTSEDTQKGCWVSLFFFLSSEIKIYTVRFFLQFIDFYHNIHLCKHCVKYASFIKSHTSQRKINAGTCHSP